MSLGNPRTCLVPAMKAITISVVNNGYLVQGYPHPSACTVYEPPLPNNLYVFTKLEDLQAQLPKLLNCDEFEVKTTHENHEPPRL